MTVTMRTAPKSPSRRRAFIALTRRELGVVRYARHAAEPRRRDHLLASYRRRRAQRRRQLRRKKFTWEPVSSTATLREPHPQDGFRKPHGRRPWSLEGAEFPLRDAASGEGPSYRPVKKACGRRAARPHYINMRSLFVRSTMPLRTSPPLRVLSPPTDCGRASTPPAERAGGGVGSPLARVRHRDRGRPCGTSRASASHLHAPANLHRGGYPPEHWAQGATGEIRWRHLLGH